MDIIRKSNILDQNDLLLLEDHNHSLDKVYSLHHCLSRRKVTRLILLVNFLHKYPIKAINDIIKEYIKEFSNEIIECDEYDLNALKMTTHSNHLETLKMFLKYDTSHQNINILIKNHNTPMHYAIFYSNIYALKLLIEYDASMSLTDCNNIPLLNCCPNIIKNKVSKIVNNIMLLNSLA